MGGPESGRRLRVAVLNRVFSTAGGGAETYSIRIVEHLAARHEMHIFAQKIDHEWPGVSYHHVSCPLEKPRWINQLWYGVQTWRATRSGFDIVHSHENTWHGEVQTIHVKPARGNLLGGRTGWRRAARWLKIALSPRLITNLALEAARFAPRPGRHVVLASQALRDQAVAAYPRAEPMMTVITPGVTLPGEAPSRDEARRQLGLPTAGVVLLFVANDYARKGLDTLLAAWPLLPPGAMLAVVGGKGDMPAYSEKAAALGLASQVRFLGPMRDVGPAYRAANALVHPTLDDSFAMVVLEAMAHGLPVVVSGPVHCGISALLEDGRNALLLDEPRNAGQLAGAIMRVLEDEALANRLSQEARRFAEGHGWDEAAARYEAVYRDSLRPRA